MTLDPSKLNPAQLQENFSEYHAPLTDREAVIEATRCLFCYDAPCTHACPTHIDIPKFIKKISTRNTRGSARVILESNFLGSTCARVCPVEELCEGACVLGSDHKPIAIGRLQRYATDYVLNGKIDLFKAGKPTGKKVVVVGAGPAGLSAAAELAKLGHQVTILERKPLAGGLSTYGIVVFREPVEVSLAEVEMVERLGVEIKMGVTVGVDVALESLNSNYDAVFLGVGLGKVPTLGIPGENLPGVVDGIEFIERTKTDPLETIPVGRKVAVIGAGNTAIDAATIAKRLGADQVVMIYRRTPSEMTAYDFEYDFAKREGIEYRFLTAPISVQGDSGVTGLECVRMQLGAPDASGRPRPEPIPGSNFILGCDMVISAIGQEKQTSLAEHLGLEIKNGYVVVDPNTCQTSSAKVFAGGDCVRLVGDASTVMAVQDGKMAAKGIHAMLETEVRHG